MRAEGPPHLNDASPRNQSMERAVGPRNFMETHYPGRCPGLVSHRAVGPHSLATPSIAGRMNRAVGPRNSLWPQNPGRCPGLVWHRAFGHWNPVVRVSTKGAPSYQPGATPQETIHPSSQRAESPTHFPGVASMTDRMERAVGPRNVMSPQPQGVALGWYRTGLWPSFPRHPADGIGPLALHVAQPHCLGRWIRPWN